jgi:hypothetical protein
MKLIQILNKLFKTNFDTALELYIESKRPMNTADVERYQKEYFNKSNSGYFC